MLLVKDRRPRCAIVLSGDSTWIERHGAEQLARYVEAVSGALLPIAERMPAEGAVVAIGRPETNPVVRALAERGAVVLSRSSPGKDGFVIKTAALDDRDVLVIGGSRDRGTLYGVYAFIEDVLGVGFFRDGERVPAVPTIDTGTLSVSECPRFADREDGNGCFYTYSASAWSWEEWKREFDWKAKRRANIVWPLNIGGDIMHTILHELGVYPEPPKPRTGPPTLHERAFDYARKLGMRIPVNLPSFHLPPAFYEKFPESRTLLMQWSELAPYRQLHPADPMFRRLVVEFVRHYRERYGTDHLYIAEFASESRILEGADNVQQARVTFARSMSEALREADPEAVWVPSGWSFDLSADDPGNPWQANWTTDDVRDYLDAISIPLVVWDLWSEEAAKHLATNYFFGHRWGFGVLHSFGAGSFLHGDVAGLVERVRRIEESPGARTCDLFLTMPEIIHYNGFYLELCARLAWNPAEVTVDRHIARYCEKRYGEVGTQLEEAWRLLVDTVYGPESGTVKIIMDPLYWFRPDLALVPGWPEDEERTNALRAGRPRFIPKLRRAVELFLAHEELLRENDMARRDLVDIASQWISERFNIELLRVREAFLAGDGATFEESAERCLRLLDDKVRLLASWPPYRLDREIERERANFGDDAPRAVKHRHVWVTTSETQHSVPLRDYYRMDLDGLVADYYRPRVAAYIGLLRGKLSAGATTVSDEEFDAIYTPIEERFIAAPVRSLPEGEDAPDLVRELLAAERE